MRITIEIDDDELRRVLAPLLVLPPTATTSTKLLTLADVAEQLGMSRSKTYDLIPRGHIASVAIG